MMSQQTPSLLSLAALRQAIKVVLSEKMDPSHRAVIAAYVSGNTLKASRDQWLHRALYL